MSKSAKKQPAAKAEKTKPTLSPGATKFVAGLASFDLEQLRLIEREVQAAKREALKTKGPSTSAAAKAKSLEKHAILMRNVATWLKAGDAEKVKVEATVLPKTALQELMKNAGVKNRSKIKDKAEMVAALIATAPAAMAKAA